MSRPLLLGIDEGTSAVKAVLYDTDLRTQAEARREKPLAHPRAGWVEQDPNYVLVAVVDAVGELLAATDDEVVACGLDHQGESVLAWDAESGEPLTPIVTWQDKRSQEVLDRLEADGSDAEVRERSGMPLDPYFSAGKLTWLLEHEPAVQRALDAGTLRLGTVDSWLCDVLGSGFATDPSTASRTQLSAPGEPDWDPRLLELFGVPRDSLPAIRDSVGDLGVLRHPGWDRELPLRAQVVDQQAALAGAGCVEPGRVKATYGTGVFVLAHAGTARPEPSEGGLLPTVAWRVDGRVDYALDGGVFTAGALLEWLSRDSGSRQTRRRWPRSPHTWTTAPASACFRRSPVWAHPGGGPGRPRSSQGSPDALVRDTWRGPRSRPSRGGSQTSSRWSRSTPSRRPSGSTGG